jgi:hypothetical protein
MIFITRGEMVKSLSNVAMVMRDLFADTQWRLTYAAQNSVSVKLPKSFIKDGQILAESLLCR